MKRYTLLFLLFIIIYSCSLYSEGIAEGTLVKTSDGYTKIENLCVGDHVVCYDAEKHLVENPIVCITKKSVERYVRVKTAEEFLRVASDQKFYNKNNDTWIEAESLSVYTFLNDQKISLEIVYESIDLYLLTIEQCHNFFISTSDICVHNFFPAALIAISVLFGSGGIEIAGISFGLGALGTYFGYQWHKKNKQNHSGSLQVQFYHNGMMPEDPEEEKKKKREQAREEYQPLTNKQARTRAEKLGYRETKDHPCGNTYDKPVFTNGKNYISPDRTGHKGGVWKIFNKRGDRIATVNIDLTSSIGV